MGEEKITYHKRKVTANVAYEILSKGSFEDVVEAEGLPPSVR